MIVQIGISWIVSVLLGCWCFSLLVRLVSETVARKRKRLISQRTNKAFWLGIALMVVSGLGSLLGGTLAVFLKHEYGDGSGRISSIGIVGGALGLFAVFLFIWAVVGDHSRGRVRCPKCWYDMSAATGLLCPECGHTVKNAKQLKKARRPRWAFVLGGMLLVLGGVGIGLNDRVKHRGYLAIMPDWMMLMGWESYPDHWVYDTGTNRQDSSLVKRISYRFVSSDASHELAEGLFDRMILDQGERWSPKNHAILRAIYQNNKQGWVPSGDKLEQLFVLCSQDILGAIQSEDPSPIESVALDIEPRYIFNDDIYHLSWSWLLEVGGTNFIYRTYDRTLFLNSKKLTQSTAGILGGLRQMAIQIDLNEILVSDDYPEKRKRAIQLLKDVGGLDAYLEGYLELGLSVDQDENKSVVLCHALAITMLSDENRIEEFDKLVSLIRDGDVDERGYVLRLMVPLSRMVRSANEAVIETRRGLVRAAVDIGLGDQSTETLGSEGLTINQLATEAITADDQSGRYAFPIVRESFLRNGELPDGMDGYQFYTHEETDERIHNWVESFRNLHRSSSFSVRMWLVENFPESVDSPDDERLGEMLNTLLKDEDLDVSGKAELLLYEREELKMKP